MANWNLTNIEINYPSLNDNCTPISSKTMQYYAIDHLTFKYADYCLNLHFTEDFQKKYVFDINKINSDYELLVEGDISQTLISNELIKLNLPQFNFKFEEIIFSSNIQYFYMENDDDYNYDAKQNIEFIKSGDYGYVIEYKSNYTIKEYFDNETETDAIKQIVNNGIKKIFEHFFQQTNKTSTNIKLKAMPNVDQLLNEINSMKTIELS